MHLEELLWLPHPRGQALERDIHGGDRDAVQKLRLMALEYCEHDSEQDVEAVQKQNGLHTELRLFFF
jgi:hypothetical protein